jgi:ABC-type transport system substrate-binding protein
VTDDGKMIATYQLRPDVTWADGTLLTTADLMFTYRVLHDALLIGNRLVNVGMISIL